MSQLAINSSGVHIAGNFQGWNPSTTSLTAGAGGIYSITIDLPPGTYQYKFINGNSWGNDEIVPNTCGVNDGTGNYNREITVTSSSLLVPVVCFAGCSDCNILPEYIYNGNAYYAGGDCYRITNNAAWQNSTLWNASQINLTNPFSLQFIINLGSNDAGADGVVFIMQRLGTAAIGATGGGMGFASFGESLGIEFDTFQNPEFGDLPEDHIAIEIDGNVDHGNASTRLASPVAMSPYSNNTEDGNDHVAEIRWDPSTKLLSVFFDCVLRTSATVDLVTQVFSGQTNVYWGFSGATGAQFNFQTICIQSNAMLQTEYEICPGGAVQLNAGSSQSGSYNWTPSIWMDNPTSARPIVSPLSTMVYTIATTDLCSQPTTRTVTVQVMTSNPACFTLPVEIVDFNAKLYGGAICTEWNTSSEINSRSFHLWTSADNIHFNQAKSIDAQGNSQHATNYKADLDLFFTETYLRLSQEDENGTEVFYPRTLYVSFVETNHFSWSINTGQYAVVRGISDISGLRLKIFAIDGKQVAEYSFDLAGAWKQTVETAPGFYLAVISDQSGKILWKDKIVQPRCADN
jgi:hypothetical protein